MDFGARTIDEVVVLDASEYLPQQAKRPPLRSAVEQLAGAGHRQILIDLAGVRYVDSAGLGELLAAKKSALVARAQLKLLRPRGQMYGLLAQSSLERVFECFDDEQVALRSFRN